MLCYCVIGFVYKLRPSGKWRDWYPSKDRMVIDLFIKKAKVVSVKFEEKYAAITRKLSGILLTLIVFKVKKIDFAKRLNSRA